MNRKRFQFARNKHVLAKGKAEHGKPAKQCRGDGTRHETDLFRTPGVSLASVLFLNFTGTYGGGGPPIRTTGSGNRSRNSFSRKISTWCSPNCWNWTPPK